MGTFQNRLRVSILKNQSCRCVCWAGRTANKWPSEGLCLLGCWGEVIPIHFCWINEQWIVRIQGFSMKTHGNNSGGSKKLCGMIWNWWNWWDFVIPKIYMYTWKEVHLCDPYICVFIHVYMFTNYRKGKILYPGIKEQIFVSIFQLFFLYLFVV